MPPDSTAWATWMQRAEAAVEANLPDSAEACFARGFEAGDAITASTRIQYHRARIANRLRWAKQLAVKGEASKSVVTSEATIALLLSRAERNDSLLAEAYFGLGIGHYFLSNFERVSHAANQAYQCITKVKSQHNQLALSAQNLAAAGYAAIGDYGKAISIHERILLYSNRDWAESRAYTNLSLIYTSQGDYDKAKQFLQKSLRLNHELKSPVYDIATVHMNIGFTHLMAQEPDSAVRWFNKALPVKAQVDGPTSLNVGSLHENIGSCYHLMGNPQRALEEFERALELFRLNVRPDHPNLASVFANMAIAHGSLQQPDSAQHYFVKAQEVLQLNIGDDFSGLFINHEAIPMLLRIQRDQAAFFVEQAANSDQQIQWLNKALDVHRQSFEVVDALRTRLHGAESDEFWTEDVSEQKAGAIRVAHTLHHQTGDEAYLETALEFSERSRSVQLLKSMRFLENAESGPRELLEPEQECNRQLAEVSSLLANPRNAATDSLHAVKFRLEQSRDSLLDAIRTHHPRYFKLRFGAKPASLPTIRQQLLQPGTALLEFLLGDTIGYVFAVTNDTIALHAFPIDSGLLLHRDRFITELAHPTLGTGAQEAFEQWTTSAHALYQTLVAGVEPALSAQNVSRLLIVADGWLGELPLDVLLTGPASGAANYRNLPYLLQRYSVQYGYSATVMTALLQQHGDLLPEAPSYGFAPVHFAESALADLPHTANEVTGAMQVVGGTSFQNATANKGVFLGFSRKLEQIGMIHLATHAIAERDNPYLSRLYFAGDSGEHSMLRGYEIHNLQLDCRLMVLSACQTGAGKLGRGEGVQSLGWSFLNAGCKSVVMSHWPANDLTTASLMQRFYEELALGKPTDEALQHAKQSAVAAADAAHAHPHFWAGFTGMGNATPVIAPPVPLLSYAIGIPLALLLYLLAHRGRIAIRNRQRKNRV